MSTRINLEVSGSARQDIDYELSSMHVQIPAQNSAGIVRFYPILDWDVDPGEIATIAIGELEGNLVAGQPNTLSIELGDGPVPPNYKEDISADLRVYSDMRVEKDSVIFELRIYNFGAENSSESQLDLILRTDLSNPATNVFTHTFAVPALLSRYSYSRSVEVPLSTLPASTSFYGFAVLARTIEEISNSSGFGHDYIGFSLDSERRVVTQCRSDANQPIQTGSDPLFSEQWHLSNTGQSAFSASGGTAGADLRMDSTLESGPYGNNVRVAIVDTGLEQCHSDLLENIEENASYNFAADPLGLDPWFGAVVSDAFNPYSLGDHGTSIAGIVAASVGNGSGGRGIAPSALIRGYNFLSSQNGTQASSLGASSSNPNSSNTDVFNMSYGSIGSQRNPSVRLTDVFLHGTTVLRNGLGAVYVKAAGNGFQRCFSIEHEMRSTLGCRSASGDPTNNLPYLIVVGGFNADDVRASYASAGSNLWVTAPSGQYGATYPAVVTVDQQGLDRGYDVLVSRGLAVDNDSNEDGNYISTFNGTSAAAPMVTGAVATILSENALLSWRDVKHILASTARQLDQESPSVRIAFGGGRPHTLRHGWIRNDAGYWFHNWYGFGAVNLDAAVEMARSYPTNLLGDFSESAWFTSTASLAIPDFNSDGVSSSISVTDLPNSSTIEAVVVHLTGTHEFLPDLSITLTSPSGTESILNPAFNDSLAGDTELNWQLLSNAFYGETPNGTWSLKLVDAHRLHAGTLQEWSIRIYYASN
ncbi:MAG: S8 family peptidase [Gammaproteobacteria bacterium]|nr:S8 family peptidase [Gammaproteobacteria bacterium]